MFSFLTIIHNINRYIILVMLALALVRAYQGWLGKKNWDENARKTNLFTMIFFDIQLLLGLILYFTSSLVKAALQDMGAAMGDAALRFFALEHIFYGILAVAFAHLANTRAKKAADSPLKHRAAAIFFSISALFVLLGMPWDSWLP